MRDCNVVLKRCKQYKSEAITKVLKEGFDLLGGLETFIKPNHTVLIKPDLYLSTEPNKAKTTNPNVIIALTDLIANIGAKCIMADSPKGEFKQSVLDNTYLKTQMLQASNNGHAQLNANDNITTISNPNGECSRDIYVLDAINEADVIINVGKLRCDNRLGLIGCAQNLFGLIPGKMKDIIKTRCYALKDYYNYILDMYEALEHKLVLNVLDGIVGCEANDEPRILNTLIIGENPYAVDSVALNIINQNAEESLLLKESVRRGDFEFNINLAGDKVEPLICADFAYSQFLDNVKKGSSKSFTRAYNASQKRPIIPTKECKGCKTCVQNCPMKAIKMNSNQMGEYAVIEKSKCINCLKCVENCPYKVIKIRTPIKYNSVNKMIKKSLKNN